MMTPEELKEWRKGRAYTQADLADLLGVTESTVFRWETGRMSIPPMLRLALIGLDAMEGGDKQREFFSGKRPRK